MVQYQSQHILNDFSECSAPEIGIAPTTIRWRLVGQLKTEESARVRKEL